MGKIRGTLQAKGPIVSKNPDEDGNFRVDNKYYTRKELLKKFERTGGKRGLPKRKTTNFQIRLKKKTRQNKTEQKRQPVRRELVRNRHR